MLCHLIFINTEMNIKCIQFYTPTEFALTTVSANSIDCS